MLHCNNGKLTQDNRGCFQYIDKTVCEKQKQDLEDTYVKAYVELARLIKEYEDLTNPEEEITPYKQIQEAKEEPLQDKADKLAEEQERLLQELQDLRPRLEDMIEAEKKLREHIAKLSK